MTATRLDNEQRSELSNRDRDWVFSVGWDPLALEILESVGFRIDVTFKESV